MSSDDSNLTWRRWRCFCSNSSFCSSSLLKLNIIVKQFNMYCCVHKMINSLNSDCCVFCLQAISSDDLRVAASQHCSFPRNCSSREYCSSGQFVSPIPAPYYCSSYQLCVKKVLCKRGNLIVESAVMESYTLLSLHKESVGGALNSLLAHQIGHDCGYSSHFFFCII